MPVSSALQFFQTLNTYSHLYPNKQAEVAQQLENLINGTVKGRKSDGMGSENEQYVIVCKGDCGYRDGLSIMEIK